MQCLLFVRYCCNSNLTLTHPKISLVLPSERLSSLAFEAHFVHKHVLRVHSVPFKKFVCALAGVAQWIEHWPVNQRVAGSIPSQDTCLGFRTGPWLGVRKRQPHTDVSLPLFLPPFPSLKINK